MINYRKIWEKTQLPYDLFYDIVVFPSTLFISIFCLNPVKIILCKEPSLPGALTPTGQLGPLGVPPGSPCSPGSV